MVWGPTIQENNEKINTNHVSKSHLLAEERVLKTGGSLGGQKNGGLTARPGQAERSSAVTRFSLTRHSSAQLGWARVGSALLGFAPFRLAQLSPVWLGSAFAWLGWAQLAPLRWRTWALMRRQIWMKLPARPMLMSVLCLQRPT